MILIAFLWFVVDQILIIITMSVTLWLTGEQQLDKQDNVVDASGGGACSLFVDLFKSLKNLPPAMFRVLAVTWVRPPRRIEHRSIAHHHLPHSYSFALVPRGRWAEIISKKGKA